MNPSLESAIKQLKKTPESVSVVSSDLKDEAVSSTLRDLQAHVKKLLKQRKCDVAIVVFSEARKIN